MGRPTKFGLDYFPLDTEWDMKMRLVKARFGLVGIGCIIELYKLIYHEGYYIKWDDETRLLFSSDNHIDEITLTEIVVFSTEKGVFDAGKLDFLGVLTSRGIQKRWLKIAKESNRSVKKIDEKYDLLEDHELSVRETEFPVQEITLKNELSGKESAQSKVKESKEKNTTQERSSAPCVEVDTFDSFLAYFIKTWNDAGCTPRFSPVLSANLTTDERDKFGNASARVKDIPRAVKAIQNYSEIQNSPEHQTRGSYKLPGFLISGIDEYADDADPWSRFKKPGVQATRDREALIAQIADEIDAESGISQDDDFTVDPFLEEMRSRQNVG